MRKISGGLTARTQLEGDAQFLALLFSMDAGALLRGANLPDDAVAILVAAQLRSRDESYRVRYPEARSELLEVADQPVGRLVTDAPGDHLRLIDIALMPDRRGRGIGTAVIQSLQAEASTSGVPLRLSVLRSNAGAHRLYARLGFVAERSDDVAVAMRWRP